MSENKKLPLPESYHKTIAAMKKSIRCLERTQKVEEDLKKTKAELLAAQKLEAAHRLVIRLEPILHRMWVDTAVGIRPGGEDVVVEFFGSPFRWSRDVGRKMQISVSGNNLEYYWSWCPDDVASILKPYGYDVSANPLASADPDYFIEPFLILCAQGEVLKERSAEKAT